MVMLKKFCAIPSRPICESLTLITFENNGYSFAVDTTRPQKEEGNQGITGEEI